MIMRIASIDIGTNTVRLMVADWEEDKPLSSLRREALITRLGEDVNQHNQLKMEAIDRTMKALSNFKEILEFEAAQEVIAAATSAVRDAHNSRVFLDQAERILGTKVQVLSGEKEAQLAYLGATHDLSAVHTKLPAAPLVLVLDIGGGSTELIAGRPPEVFYRRSLNIGSVRLKEMFLISDPPTTDEVTKTRDYIDEVCHPTISEIENFAWWQGRKDVVLIGVAGTITTIAAVKQELAKYDWRKIHNFALDQDDVDTVLAKFLSKPLAERKKIAGLEPRRADVIIAGTLIVQSVMESLSFDEIIVSESDILDGLILSFPHFNTVF